MKFIKFNDSKTEGVLKKPDHLPSISILIIKFLFLGCIVICNLSRNNFGVIYQFSII